MQSAFSAKSRKTHTHTQTQKYQKKAKKKIAITSDKDIEVVELEQTKTRKWAEKAVEMKEKSNHLRINEQFSVFQEKMSENYLIL